MYENIIVLNPTVNDLLSDNIYKLNIEDKEFYVPLWHHELYFSLHDKDLIVKCIPELDNNNLNFVLYWSADHYDNPDEKKEVEGVITVQVNQMQSDKSEINKSCLINVNTGNITAFKSHFGALQHATAVATKRTVL